MKTLRLLFSSGLLLLLVLSACNLPQAASPTPDLAAAAMTAAAQTVQAVVEGQATENVPPPLPATPIPPTAAQPAATTAAPTAAAAATPTAANTCNQATFVADVTVPDGSKMTPGKKFTKTWRLKNTGTCSWTTQYALVFASGAQMGGPTVQQLTQVVNPGETVDLSVELTAPNAAGAYRGYWKLRDANGNVFGLSNGNAFWVDIKVESAAAAPPTATPMIVPVTVGPPPVVVPLTITVAAYDSGAVVGDGSLLAYPNVGDTDTDFGSQGFISFDLSAIPAGSSFLQVQVDFSSYDTLGDPFGSLGCLRLYAQDYGSIDPGDYFTGNAIGSYERWCNTGELSTVWDANGDLLSYLEGRAGSTAQFRLQFSDTESDYDGITDMVRFGQMQFIITYTAP